MDDDIARALNEFQQVLKLPTVGSPGWTDELTDLETTQDTET